MFRGSIPLWIVVLASVSQSTRAQGPTVAIERASPDEQRPWIFELKGSANVPKELRPAEGLSVVIYTRSGGGGYLQLQMLGEEGVREPNNVELQFGDQGQTEWELPNIWLGNKEIRDPPYSVYAVVLRSFTEADGARLITLTHNRYKSFQGVLDVLRKENFGPIAYTHIRVKTK